MTFIEELEQKAAELKQKKDALRELYRQYKQFYSKDIRDEIAAKKAEVAKMQAGVSELVWENLVELTMMKRYTPEFYAMLLEDPDIGAVIRRKDWLVDRKEEKKDVAEKRLNDIKKQRGQLKEARQFVEKWPGRELDAKSLVATWPALKGAVEGEMDKLDVVAAIEKKDRELVREGWQALLNSSMVARPLKKFLDRTRKLRSEEHVKQLEMAKAKGNGSVKEYEAKKAYDEAKARRERMERACKHLLLASPLFLENMKKELKTGKKDKGELERLVAVTSVKRINETEWLKEMRKRLGTE